jgi:hypothetical protein
VKESRQPNPKCQPVRGTADVHNIEADRHSKRSDIMSVLIRRVVLCAGLVGLIWFVQPKTAVAQFHMDHARNYSGATRWMNNSLRDERIVAYYLKVPYATARDHLGRYHRSSFRPYYDDLSVRNGYHRMPLHQPYDPYDVRPRPRRTYYDYDEVPFEYLPNAGASNGFNNGMNNGMNGRADNGTGLNNNSAGFDEAAYDVNGGLYDNGWLHEGIADDGVTRRPYDAPRPNRVGVRPFWDREQRRPLAGTPARPHPDALLGPDYHMVLRPRLTDALEPQFEARKRPNFNVPVGPYFTEPQLPNVIGSYPVTPYPQTLPSYHDRQRFPTGDAGTLYVHPSYVFPATGGPLNPR